ncbi:MAG: hypothetical protein GY928_17825 [Colwellia sp.]|nr:hypothetical protein [Colwellia sp.]
MQISAAKFTPKVITKHLIEQTELVQHLTAKPLRNVAIVQGLAGYGKTTLLLQYLAWLQAKKARTIWINLEKADNDISRLLQVVSEASNASVSGSSKVATKENPHNTDDLNVLLSAIADNEQPFYLFLDNFDVITEPSTLSILSDALNHLKSHQQIIIASRTAPKLALSKLKIADNLIEVSTSELKFSFEQTKVYFSRFGDIQLNEEQICKLYELTDGWPAALKLSTFLIKQPEQLSQLTVDGKVTSELFDDYLIENIFNHKSAEQQEFLVKTSILSEFNLPLCQHLLADTFSAGRVATMLNEDLEESILIESTNQQQSWLSYHQLFASFLIKLLKRDYAEQVEPLHVKAAKWFKENNRPRLAIEHAIAGNANELAAQMMDDFALPMLRKAQFNTLADWTNSISSELLNQHINLYLAKTWADLFYKRTLLVEKDISQISEWQKANKLTKEQQRIFTSLKISFSIMSDNNDETLNVVQALLADNQPSNHSLVRIGFYNIQAYIHLSQAKFEDARIDGMNALALTQFMGKNKSSDNVFFTVTYAHAVQAFALLLQGKLKRALAVAEQGLRDFYQQDFIESANAYGVLPAYTSLLYETNKLDDCETILTRNLSLIRQFALPEWLAVSYLCLARIHLAKNNTNDAIKVIETLEQIGYSDHLPRLSAIARWELVRIHLNNGEVILANDIAERISSENLVVKKAQCSIAADNEADTITSIRLLLANQQYKKALKQIADAIEQSQPNRHYRILKLEVLKVVALKQSNEHRQALRLLTKLVAQGQNEGFVRTFVDEGEVISELLKELYQTLDDYNSKLALYIASLLAAFGIEANAAQYEEVNNRLIEPLTKREEELLHLINKGHTNSKISALLSLSESTVKWHLSNLFSKLGVKRRNQATSKARELGLL